MSRLLGSHDAPGFQLDALVDGADGARVRLCGRGPPGTVAGPLLDCSVDGRFGDGKTHGVVGVTPGQDAKTHHWTTIGPKPDPGSLRLAREACWTRMEEAHAQVRVHVRDLQEEL